MSGGSQYQQPNRFSHSYDHTSKHQMLHDELFNCKVTSNCTTCNQFGLWCNDHADDGYVMYGLLSGGTLISCMAGAKK